MKNIAIALLALISLFSVSLHSDELTDIEYLEEFYGDESMVEITTGTKKPIYRAPAVANVVDADDIRRLGATTLDEILETIPGIHVRDALTPGSSVYNIRGFGSYASNPQVLTLINGTPINSRTTNGGRPNAFHMPVANIDRVEVIRGPGSAVYGADAYSGVINVITKDVSSTFGTEMGVRHGSFDSHSIWATHRQALGDWKVYAGFEYQATDGDDGRIISEDLQTGLDALFATNASLAPGPLNTGYEAADVRLSASTDVWHIRMGHLFTANAGTGAGAAQALDSYGDINSEITTLDFTYRNDFYDILDVEGIFAYTHMEGRPDFQILPPGSTVPIGADGNLFTAPSGSCPLIAPDTPLCVVTFTDGVLGNPYYEEDHYNFELIGLYDKFDKHNIRISIGTQFHEVSVSEAKNFGPGVIDGTVPVVGGTLTTINNNDDIYFKDGGADRTVSFITLQDEWAIHNDWELTAGLRYDRYSDFGSTVNPRLALVWQNAFNMTTKLLYGRAFRAPSFNELFLQNNPVALGDDDLEPETIETLEFVVDYRPSMDSQIIFNSFVYEAKDIIRYVRDAGTGSTQAQNTMGQEGVGFEMEASSKIFKNISLYSNFSYVDAKDNLTDDDVPDIPEKQFYARATWAPVDRFEATMQVNWVGGRKRLRKDPNELTSVADTRDEIKDYATADFIINRSGIIDFSFSVKNMFNKNGREPSPAPNVSIPGDFPIPGRHYQVSFAYSF